MNKLLYTTDTDVTATDFRKAWLPFSEGILGEDSFEVTAGETGLTVDVATGNGFVQGDEDSDQGLYFISADEAVNSDELLTPIAPADETDPRVDIVIAQVYDHEWDELGQFGWTVEVIPGTPTAGADLSNRNGAPALPDNALHLADVLVAANATEITGGDIEDRRTTSATGGAVPLSLFDAAGDLLIGTADNTAAKLSAGTEGHVLTVSSGVPAWAPATGGTGALPLRDEIVETTGSLADAASEDIDVTAIGASSLRLISLETDVEARVRVYGTDADRDADAARPVGTDPTGDHGVLLDFVTTTGDLAPRLSPQVDCSNLDAMPTDTLYMRVTNLSGSTDTVEVTLTYIPTEGVEGS